MGTKSMTLRLPDQQAADLEALARVEGIPVSQAVRDAIASHIDERRKDKEFRNRLKRMIGENQEILERLSK